MVPKSENTRLGSPLHRRSFLGGSIAAAVAATSVGGATTADAATTTGLKVGAGRAAIDIPSSLLPLDGFTTVHDDLFVRILLLENGSRRVALAVLDLTSISAEAITAMRTTIAEASGVATADIVVTVTHTFSAPHVRETTSSTAAAQYVQQITKAAATAIAAAVKGLKPARVGTGTGICDVNVNRDVLTADGWWLGTGETGSSDKSVGVTRLDDLDGNPIAVLINYSVPSSVMMESVMASSVLRGWLSRVELLPGRVRSWAADGAPAHGMCGHLRGEGCGGHYVVDASPHSSTAGALSPRRPTGRTPGRSPSAASRPEPSL
ncbi:hypothetical protein [Streptomyces sp. A30]|uniref:hypothetical protein n=1 Tax=Streptomyces sp. A30 TaxID=2789273 RepID=UPI003980A70B